VVVPIGPNFLHSICSIYSPHFVGELKFSKPIDLARCKSSYLG